MGGWLIFFVGRMGIREPIDVLKREIRREQLT